MLYWAASSAPRGVLSTRLVQELATVVLTLALAAAAGSLALAFWRLRRVLDEASLLVAHMTRGVEGLRPLGEGVEHLVRASAEVSAAAVRLSRMARRVEFLERVAERRVARLLFAVSGALAALEGVVQALRRGAGDPREGSAAARDLEPPSGSA
jgi:hypothetical protein